MRAQRIDHLVLTVRDIRQSVEFYTSILGMEKVEFGGGRIALAFGQQKINLHQLGHEFEPKAQNPKEGSADLCLIVDTPIADAIAEVTAKGQPIVEGPVRRTGASGEILSAYLRDPDGNLIEIANYL